MFKYHVILPEEGENQIGRLIASQQGYYAPITEALSSGRITHCDTFLGWNAEAGIVSIYHQDKKQLLAEARLKPNLVLAGENASYFGFVSPNSSYGGKDIPLLPIEWDKINVPDEYNLYFFPEERILIEDNRFNRRKVTAIIKTNFGILSNPEKLNRLDLILIFSTLINNYLYILEEKDRPYIDTAKRINLLINFKNIAQSFHETISELKLMLLNHEESKFIAEYFIPELKIFLEEEWGFQENLDQNDFSGYLDKIVFLVEKQKIDGNIFKTIIIKHEKLLEKYNITLKEHFDVFKEATIEIYRQNRPMLFDSISKDDSDLAVTIAKFIIKYKGIYDNSNNLLEPLDVLLLKYQGKNNEICLLIKLFDAHFKFDDGSFSPTRSVLKLFNLIARHFRPLSEDEINAILYCTPEQLKKFVSSKPDYFEISMLLCSLKNKDIPKDKLNEVNIMLNGLRFVSPEKIEEANDMFKLLNLKDKNTVFVLNTTNKSAFEEISSLVLNLNNKNLFNDLIQNKLFEKLHSIYSKNNLHFSQNIKPYALYFIEKSILNSRTTDSVIENVEKISNSAIDDIVWLCYKMYDKSKNTIQEKNEVQEELLKLIDTVYDTNLANIENFINDKLLLKECVSTNYDTTAIKAGIKDLITKIKEDNKPEPVSSARNSYFILNN